MSCSVQVDTIPSQGDTGLNFHSIGVVCISLIYDLSGTPCLPLGILYVDGFALV